MASLGKISIKDSLLTVIGILFSLMVYGAIPFLLLPTTGQANWAMGFAESLSNGSIFSLHALNIGHPEPAPMAFGIPETWVASILLRLGLSSADAYSLTFALFLILAYIAVLKIANIYNIKNKILANLAAVAWLTSPAIIYHSGYSILSLGIALLPFYFLAPLALIERGENLSRSSIGLLSLLYLASGIISIFTDGYSFMMFFAGSSILIFSDLLFPGGLFRGKSRRKYLNCLIHLASFIAAYYLYSNYIGSSGFEPQGLDSFRGWGADLTFFLVPTEGLHWLSDAIGFHVRRSEANFWGDGSTYRTTFILAWLVATFFLAIAARKRITRYIPLLVIAFFGLYMSLGPVLKINYTKTSLISQSIFNQSEIADIREFRAMPEKYVVNIPATGSGFLSKKLPGFNVMRSAYRWSALFVFGVLIFVLMSVSSYHRKKEKYFAALFTLIIALQLPNLSKSLPRHITLRGQFSKTDSHLVAPLTQATNKAERVIFLPWDNDFILNIIVPKAGLIAYNIGGDKNVQMARKQWPSSFKNLGGIRRRAQILEDIYNNKSVVNDYKLGIKEALIDGDVDAVVIPYFDTLQAAHSWRCKSPQDSSCVERERGLLQPLLIAIDETETLQREESTFFSVIRLRS